MIDPIDPLRFLREHPEMFFEKQPPQASEIVGSVAETLRAANVQDVRTHQASMDGGWWVVVAADDWVPATGRSLEELFSRVWPMPETGVNSMRAEVLVTAFAKEAVTISSDGQRWDISGKTADDAEIWMYLAALKDCGRAIAVRT